MDTGIQCAEMFRPACSTQKRSDLMQTDFMNTTGYSPVGDISVMALCYAMGALLMFNNVHRSVRFRLMLLMVCALLGAAICNVCYHSFLFDAHSQAITIYVLRITQHTLLSTILVLYTIYLREPLWMEYYGYRRFIIGISIIGFAPVIIDIIGIMMKFGFYIDENGAHSEFMIYPLAYIAFEVTIYYLIIRYRGRIIRQVFFGLLSTNVLSLILTSVQGFMRQTSFITVAYAIPVLGIMIMFHSSPFDQETGAANDTYFYKELSGCIERKQQLLMISCTIPDIYNKMKDISALKSEFVKFFKQNVKKGVLYRFPNRRFLLTIRVSRKRDYEQQVKAAIEDFYDCYLKYNIDFKITVAQIVPEIMNAEEYISLISFVEADTPMNTTHRITQNDVERYLGSSYIISELSDIVRKNDLDDERVLVYCQPVFNLLTGTYDTAEALMRLRLPEKGMVFPDQFIPIAEKHGMIHTLSKIILNKTCRMIHELLDEGYLLNRISVNFSMIDVRQEDFCSEIQKIVSDNSIPFNTIAVELTESRSETDFNRVKQKIEELQGLGIKFYLDDFGTGYSNFERIMEIPFDIIKFDRSLLTESVKNDSSRFMVSTFASMFNELHYAVLFEGVENETDEMHCKGMHAKYLQGYKYSKPIPIADLRQFLTKQVAV